MKIRIMPSDTDLIDRYEIWGKKPAGSLYPPFRFYDFLLTDKSKPHDLEGKKDKHGAPWIKYNLSDVVKQYSGVELEVYNQ